MPPIDKLLAAIQQGKIAPIYLVVGDLVLAEPSAQRLADALAARSGCGVEVQRHPQRLRPVLEDLKTFSLFASGKVVMVVDSAVLADKNAAGDLVDQAAEALPLGKGGALSGRDRLAASRLLQALRLFGIDPYAGSAEAAIEELPSAALQGGAAYRKKKQGRPRPKGEIEALRPGLIELLTAARAEDIVGLGEGDLAELQAIVTGGLPPGHVLVLAESAASLEHPISEALIRAGAVLDVGRVEAERGGGWLGLDGLAAELERQTGSAIARDALEELARRTLRQGEQHADSTSRFAAEYRKLAEIAQAESPNGRIERALVTGAVEDRGEEDVWQMLDAIAAGRGGEALDRLGRMLRGAEDPLAARLSFFSLLAGYCRQLVAVGGLIEERRLPRGEGNYNRFKTSIAPPMQAELAGGRKNPIGGLHPFRLHRVYLAASRMPVPDLRLLMSRVLETELRIKGESGEADAALAELVVRLSARAQAPAGRGTAGSRR